MTPEVRPSPDAFASIPRDLWPDIDAMPVGEAWSYCYQWVRHHKTEADRKFDRAFEAAAAAYDTDPCEANRIWHDANGVAWDLHEGNKVRFDDDGEPMLSEVDYGDVVLAKLDHEEGHEGYPCLDQVTLSMPLCWESAWSGDCIPGIRFTGRGSTWIELEWPPVAVFYQCCDADEDDEGEEPYCEGWAGGVLQYQNPDTGDWEPCPFIETYDMWPSWGKAGPFTPETLYCFRVVYTYGGAANSPLIEGPACTMTLEGDWSIYREIMSGGVVVDGEAPNTSGYPLEYGEVKADGVALISGSQSAVPSGGALLDGTATVSKINNYNPPDEDGDGLPDVGGVVINTPRRNYRVPVRVPVGAVSAYLPKFFLAVVIRDVSPSSQPEDVFVTTAAGAVLPHEVRKFEPETGRLWVVFKTPLRHDADNDFYVYTGAF